MVYDDVEEVDTLVVVAKGNKVAEVELDDCIQAALEVVDNILAAYIAVAVAAAGNTPACSTHNMMTAVSDDGSDGDYAGKSDGGGDGDVREAVVACLQLQLDNYKKTKRTSTKMITEEKDSALFIY